MGSQPLQAELRLLVLKLLKARLNSLDGAIRGHSVSPSIHGGEWSKLGPWLHLDELSNRRLQGLIAWRGV
jgi:hypothetical protein